MTDYLDFDDVTVGSVVFVEKNQILNKYSWKEPRVDLIAGDIFLVTFISGRPRRATLRNLQRGYVVDVRVDELLALNDDYFVTIGPL